MVRVNKHGKFNTFNSTECPECGCEFEYTQEYIDKNDGYLKCPECLHIIAGVKDVSCEDVSSEDNKLKGSYVCVDDDNNTTVVNKLIYKRDSTKEEAAIAECIASIDFDILAKTCKCLSENIEDCDYLGALDAENLKATAIRELRNCFEQMAIYGYTISYCYGGKDISYCSDGVFNVDTFYNQNYDEYWCTCGYSIQQATSF